MKAKHTAGPWHHSYSGLSFGIRSDSKEHPEIATTEMCDRFETQEANANLICAAPDLLEALESALETMKENEWYTPLSVIVQAEKALKKAKGEK